MLPFMKLQGAGNDYIAIDGRGESYDWNKLSIAMSTPAFGVGSDGIVVVFDSRIADIRMRIYNPDGSEAEISGNGIRLFTKFVIDKKIFVPKNNVIKNMHVVKINDPLDRSRRVIKKIELLNFYLLFV